jgi:large subunit ribosomal protein L14e
MIDGPVGRQVINFKRIKLTKFKLKIPKGLSSKLIYEKFLKENILKIWFKSKWGQNYFVKKKKNEFSDYEKFKFMLGKKYKQKFFLKV